MFFNLPKEANREYFSRSAMKMTSSQWQRALGVQDIQVQVVQKKKPQQAQVSISGSHRGLQEPPKQREVVKADDENSKTVWNYGPLRAQNYYEFKDEVLLLKIENFRDAPGKKLAFNLNFLEARDLGIVLDDFSQEVTVDIRKPEDEFVLTLLRTLS